jgi:hypothetical protein
MNSAASCCNEECYQWETIKRKETKNSKEITARINELYAEYKKNSKMLLI